MRAGKGAKIKVDAEIGFLNDSPVLVFANHAVSLTFIAETSDGKCAFFTHTRYLVSGSSSRPSMTDQLAVRRKWAKVRKSPSMSSYSARTSQSTAM